VVHGLFNKVGTSLATRQAPRVVYATAEQGTSSGNVDRIESQPSGKFTKGALEQLAAYIHILRSRHCLATTPGPLKLKDMAREGNRRTQFEVVLWYGVPLKRR
jgi:hypothetical protein